MRYNKFIFPQIVQKKKKNKLFYKVRLAVLLLWPAQTLAKLVYFLLVLYAKLEMTSDSTIIRKTKDLKI